MAYPVVAGGPLKCVRGRQNLPGEAGGTQKSRKGFGKRGGVDDGGTEGEAQGGIPEGKQQIDTVVEDVVHSWHIQKKKKLFSFYIQEFCVQDSAT